MRKHYGSELLLICWFEADRSMIPWSSFSPKDGLQIQPIQKRIIHQLFQCRYDTKAYVYCMRIELDCMQLD